MLTIPPEETVLLSMRSGPDDGLYAPGCADDTMRALLDRYNEAFDGRWESDQEAS